MVKTSTIMMLAKALVSIWQNNFTDLVCSGSMRSLNPSAPILRILKIKL
jgi:hypothetical protein